MDEQEHIAEVFWTLDARLEIEAEGLEQLLVVKQALSDALLTGRIRVAEEHRK